MDESGRESPIAPEVINVSEPGIYIIGKDPNEAEGIDAIEKDLKNKFPGLPIHRKGVNVGRSSSKAIFALRVVSPEERYIHKISPNNELSYKDEKNYKFREIGTDPARVNNFMDLVVVGLAKKPIVSFREYNIGELKVTKLTVSLTKEERIAELTRQHEEIEKRRGNQPQ